MSDNAHTIKITCVILRFQLGNKFRLLSQQTVPVQGAEEAMLLHFVGTTWKGAERGRHERLHHPSSKRKPQASQNV